jgi:ATPase subunit of ABC transporter with duplicated ATPase domains
LDTIEWLESYLKTQDVPMVIISHDRAFLDQLCTKIVETEFGVSKTYKGNYSEYVLAKEIWVQTQYAAWEKQQKEIEQTKELINRLGAGVNAGRASSEQKVATPTAGCISRPDQPLCLQQLFLLYFITFCLFYHVFTNFYLLSNARNWKSLKRKG